MKIESTQIDPKTRAGSLRLLPNNTDDIYCLSTLVAPGDKVSCYTTRKLSLDGGKTQKKITLRLEVKVESVDSDLVAGIMYIKGKTSSENEHVRIGSYHTLDVSVGNSFTLTKNEWKKQCMERLNDCCKEIPEICTVVLYDKDCVVSIISSNGVKIVHKEETKGKNYKDVVANLIKLKQKIRSLVIAGISEARNDLYKQLIREDSSIGKATTVVKLGLEYKGLSNSKTVSNMLADPAILMSLQSVQFVDDLREIQRFYAAIDVHQEEVCVGIKEVAEAMDYGAVKVLFVTDKFRRPMTVAEREFSDGFIKKAVELRAKVCVVPTSLDLGERLETMGGVACFLSFNYK